MIAASPANLSKWRDVISSWIKPANVLFRSSLQLLSVALLSSSNSPLNHADSALSFLNHHSSSSAASQSMVYLATFLSESNPLLALLVALKVLCHSDWSNDSPSFMEGLDAVHNVFDLMSKQMKLGADINSADSSEKLAKRSLQPALDLVEECRLSGPGCYFFCVIYFSNASKLYLLFSRSFDKFIVTLLFNFHVLQIIIAIIFNQYFFKVLSSENLFDWKLLFQKLHLSSSFYCVTKRPVLFVAVALVFLRAVLLPRLRFRHSDSANISTNKAFIIAAAVSSARVFNEFGVSHPPSKIYCESAKLLLASFVNSLSHCCSSFKMAIITSFDDPLLTETLLRDPSCLLCSALSCPSDSIHLSDLVHTQSKFVSASSVPQPFASSAHDVWHFALFFTLQYSASSIPHIVWVLSNSFIPLPELRAFENYSSKAGMLTRTIMQFLQSLSSYPAFSSDAEQKQLDLFKGISGLVLQLPRPVFASYGDMWSADRFRAAIKLACLTLEIFPSSSSSEFVSERYAIIRFLIGALTGFDSMHGSITVAKHQLQFAYTSKLCAAFRSQFPDVLQRLCNCLKLSEATQLVRSLSAI